MRRKLLFLLAIAIWFASRDLDAQRTGYCGDGICQTISCTVTGGDPGNGCEEDASNCYVDCSCLSPHPVWVVTSDTVIAAFQAFSSDDTGPFCEYVLIHRQILQDQQLCVSARQPDTYSCYFDDAARLYAPQNTACCAVYGCYGSQSCPAP